MPYHRAGLGKAERLGLPKQHEYVLPDKNLLKQIQQQIG
jgi:hypothetical protein